MELTEVSFQTRVRRNKQSHQTKNPRMTETTANGDIAIDTRKIKSEFGNMFPKIISHNPKQNEATVTIPPNDIAMVLFRDISLMLL